MKIYVENDTRIASIYAGHALNIVLPQSNRMTLTFPAVSYSQQPQPFASQIEYAIFGGEGRIFALVGFVFEPDTSTQLTIEIGIHDSRQVHESRLTLDLQRSFPRGPFNGIFFHGLRERDAVALQQGLQQHAQNYTLKAGTCRIIAGAWNEKAASTMAHKLVSSRLILATITLPEYNPANVAQSIINTLAFKL